MITPFAIISNRFPFPSAIAPVTQPLSSVSSFVARVLLRIPADGRFAPYRLEKCKY